MDPTPDEPPPHDETMIESSIVEYCRDLKTMEVSLDTALSIGSAIPAGVVAVAESGIKTGEDLRRLAEAGFSGFLVGEHLMSAPDPGEALRALLASAAGGDA